MKKRALLAATSLALLGLAAALVALVVGVFAHSFGAQRRVADRIALQLGLTTTALCAWYLWPAALNLAGGERLFFAAFVGVAPLGFGFVLQLNARYWLRRVEMELAVPAPWLVGAGGLTLLVTGVVAGASTARDTGGRNALEGDPNAVVVVIDGVPLASLETAFPTFAGLQQRGRLYDTAITPDPATAPVVASVLTGLHPLRSGVVVDGQRLSRGLSTVAEELAEAGFATGGFVSSPAVAAAQGFDQGFLVFDDDPAVGVPGFARLSAGRLLLQWRALSPVRPASQTVDAFAGWLQAQAEWPLFALVQLSADGPRGAGRDPRDVELERIIAELDRAQVLDRTLLIVVASGGVVGQALREPAVRVPMAIVAPQVAPERSSLVVHPMDAQPTVRAWMHLDTSVKTEGLDLLRADPIPQRSSSLVGLDGDGAPLVGIRSGVVKYERWLDSDREALYDLEDDPGEQHDLAPTQERSRGQAADAVAPDLRSLRRALEPSR